MNTPNPDYEKHPFGSMRYLLKTLWSYAWKIFLTIEANPRNKALLFTYRMNAVFVLILSTYCVSVPQE